MKRQCRKVKSWSTTCILIKSTRADWVQAPYCFTISTIFVVWSCSHDDTKKPCFRYFIIGECFQVCNISRQSPVSEIMKVRSWGYLWHMPRSRGLIQHTGLAPEIKRRWRARKTFDVPRWALQLQNSVLERSCRDRKRLEEVEGTGDEMLAQRSTWNTAM